VVSDRVVPLERIEGQPRAVELLQRALVAERVAHAYAFVGPAGSGRTTVALAFAAALVCDARGCGRCRSCALVATRQHPDVHVIVPTPPPRNPRGAPAIRIADVRQLEHEAGLKPLMASRKVFIVDDADRMTEDAPEAFLKTLEEPPDRTVLVLVLSRARAVPATVLSRCQIVRFQPRSSPRLADDMTEALDLLAEARAKGAEALFRRTQSIDRERAEALVDAYWHLLRDLLFAKSGVPEALLVNAGRGQDIAAEAARWRTDDLLAAVADCREARLSLVNNVTPRLTVEVVVSRLLTGAPEGTFVSAGAERE
jgi:DNA polymerase-3 subunit delta'